MPSHTYSLSFSQLNLTRNPFGELDLEERQALANVNSGWLADVKTASRGTWQIMGGCGFGKSTHLLACLRQIPEANYLYLDELVGGRLPNPVPSVVLVDEAQRLTRKQRRSLFSSSSTIVLATHRDLSPELRHAKRIPINIKLDGQMDPARLQHILNARIAWVRRGPGAIPQINRLAADRLFEKFGGNLRQVETTLYQLFEELNDSHGKMFD